MDKELDHYCKQCGMRAMERLLEESDAITSARHQLESEDIGDLCKIWSTISSIKTVAAMDAGAEWLKR